MNKVIPKIIHYCWFGNGQKPESFKQCLLSWETFLPDYELKEWNEGNSIKYQNKFFRDAYRKKQYAFVSDCIRVQALEEYGGIYLDTDMLLLKSLNNLLSYHFFTGFEVSNRAAYGLFGGIKGHRFFTEMRQFYDQTYFNPFSPPVITHTFQSLINESSLNGPDEVILGQEYFYPLPYHNRGEDYQKFVSESTYAVHLWDHSWGEEKKEGFWSLVKKLLTVIQDYLFYGYPKTHFVRYFKQYVRKLIRQN